MAEFSEQFDLHNPFALTFDQPEDSWPRRIAFEALRVLRKDAKTTAHAEEAQAAVRLLKSVAHTIDLVVSRRSLKLTSPIERSRPPSDPAIAARFELQRKAVARQLHGDLAIFEAGRGPDEVLTLLRQAHPGLDLADLYGVMALWKLCDYLTLRSAPATPRSFGVRFAWAHVDAHGRVNFERAAKRILEFALAEAAHASATAWRLRQEALRAGGSETTTLADSQAQELRTLIETGVDAAVKTLQSRRASVAAKKKNEVFKGEAANAVRLVRGEEQRRGRPFTAWTEAINFLTENMIKPKGEKRDGEKVEPDVFYKDRGTLRRYLGEGGWAPTPRSTKGPPKPESWHGS